LRGRRCLRTRTFILFGLPQNLSFQACRWRVLTNVWMTDQSKTKVKIQHGYEWKHCPCQS
jgi:hypothetical protein